jgi:hypothetical protein
MEASLTAAGLNADSVLVITALPEASRASLPKPGRCPYVRVPILPARVSQPHLKASQASTSTQKLPEGRAHEQQQSSAAQGGNAAGNAALRTNVDTVADPGAQEFPMIRMLCWRIVSDMRKAIPVDQRVKLPAANMQMYINQVPASPRATYTCPVSSSPDNPYA